MEYSLIYASDNTNCIGLTLDNADNVDNVDPVGLAISSVDPVDLTTTSVNYDFVSHVDRDLFSKITTYTDNPKSFNVLIVGRKTYDLLPTKMKQCIYRKYIIISKQENDNPNYKKSFREAIEFLNTLKLSILINRVFV